MQEKDLMAKVLELLKETLEEEGDAENWELTTKSPLVGADAIISSLGLVSFIVDVESMLADTFDLELLLVNEDALSRSKSPFLCAETLVEYICELAAAPATQGG